MNEPYRTLYIVKLSLQYKHPFQNGSHKTTVLDLFLVLIRRILLCYQLKNLPTAVNILFNQIKLLKGDILMMKVVKT